MTVAFGTSTPTSTIVVATRTSICPAVKRDITRSLSSDGQPAVQGLDTQPGQLVLRESGQHVEDGERGPAARSVVVLVRVRRAGSSLGVEIDLRPFTDARADHERLMAGRDLLAHLLPDPEVPLRRRDVAADRRASGGKLGQLAGVEVTEDGHGDRARDRASPS